MSDKWLNSHFFFYDDNVNGLKSTEAHKIVIVIVCVCVCECAVCPASCISYSLACNKEFK